jgi:hypothetical protein
MCRRLRIKLQAQTTPLVLHVAANRVCQVLPPVLQDMRAYVYTCLVVASQCWQKRWLCKLQSL